MLIGQIEVRLERGSNQTKAVVQIQIEAPVQLLIGTDLLSSLWVLFLLFNISKPRKKLYRRYTTPNYQPLKSRVILKGGKT